MSDDRKYGQRGYQDSGERSKSSGRGGGDREERRERPKPQGPKPFGFDPEKGPRGRGLGAPSATVFRCGECGTDQTSLEAEPATVCAKCGADLHCCTNCVHFDASIRNECREGGATLPDGTAPVRIARKRDRNECLTWKPRLAAAFAREPVRSGTTSGSSNGNDSKPRPNDARAAFDALFKI